VEVYAPLLQSFYLHQVCIANLNGAQELNSLLERKFTRRNVAVQQTSSLYCKLERRARIELITGKEVYALQLTNQQTPCKLTNGSL